jgi:hypothetical protein
LFSILFLSNPIILINISISILSIGVAWAGVESTPQYVLNMAISDMCKRSIRKRAYNLHMRQIA